MLCTMPSQSSSQSACPAWLGRVRSTSQTTGLTAGQRQCKRQWMPPSIALCRVVHPCPCRVLGEALGNTLCLSALSTIGKAEACTLPIAPHWMLDPSAVPASSIRSSASVLQFTFALIMPFMRHIVCHHELYSSTENKIYQGVMQLSAAYHHLQAFLCSASQLIGASRPAD